MSAILDQLKVWIENIIRLMGYPGISIVMLVENLFPPLPSEVVMPFAGFMVSSGEMTFLGVMIAGTIGALLGALLIYGIGRAAGEKRVRNWIEQYGKFLLLKANDLDRTLKSFEKHGAWLILIGRVVPGMRSLISLPAGLQEMNIGLFLLFTFIGTVIWNGILVGAGMALGGRWQRVLDWIDQYELVLWAVTGLFIVYFIARRLGLVEKVRELIKMDNRKT